VSITQRMSARRSLLRFNFRKVAPECHCYPGKNRCYP
jgi:hypothetical protein